MLRPDRKTVEFYQNQKSIGILKSESPIIPLPLRYCRLKCLRNVDCGWRRDTTSPRLTGLMTACLHTLLFANTPSKHTISHRISCYRQSIAKTKERSDVLVNGRTTCCLFSRRAPSFPAFSEWIRSLFTNSPFRSHLWIALCQWCVIGKE